jgi:ATP-binding cassette subfamily B multidrug efflux pump
MSADRIIVLDKGKIVEEGTHKQLLRKRGKYAVLWKYQSEGFIK